MWSTLGFTDLRTTVFACNEAQDFVTYANSWSLFGLQSPESGFRLRIRTENPVENICGPTLWGEGGENLARTTGAQSLKASLRVHFVVSWCLSYCSWLEEPGGSRVWARLRCLPGE